MDLKDVDPELIRLMLLYIYKSDYPDGEGHYEPLILHANMYALGDRYDIEDLKNLAKEKFSNILDGHALNDTFFGAVDAVYSATLPSDRGLRDCIALKMRKNWIELRGKDAFMEVVKCNGDIAIDLVDTWAASNDEPVSKSVTEPMPRYQNLIGCPICNRRQMTDMSWFGTLRCSGCHTRVSKLAQSVRARR